MLGHHGNRLTYLLRTRLTELVSWMRNTGISLRDYERLPTDIKVKAIALLEELKDELKHLGFSLSFLGFEGWWNDLNPPKFLALGEDHYRRLIRGSRWVRSQRKEDLIEEITQLFALAKQTPKEEQTGLDRWSSG